MHPEIHESKPGQCPKCGMDLYKKTVTGTNSDTIPSTKTNNDSIETYYTCIMHPEIHESKPGKCPKCGMDLYKKTVTIHQPGSDTMPNKQDFNMNENPESNNGFAQNNIPPLPSKTVRYDLYIKDTMVNFTGKAKHAIAVNGQIPMPTLTFQEGDTAEILVHNEMDVETALHWHGLFVPNKEDGVPYLTQMPIKPHSTYLYKFPIIQNGTYWYHSHSGLQEQIGLYGAFILEKRSNDPTFRKGIDDLPAIPLVLSEWTDMKPEEVDRSLHNQTDWFAIKKGATQSFSEAIATGHLKTKFTNEWKRMNAMDVSDVAYDKFLINGKNEWMLPQFKAGEKARLRIANAGASSYFWLTYAGGKITVVANDGNDVVPVDVDRLMIAVSETYDVVVTIPENRSYEFLVTPEDRTHTASLWLGSGMKMPSKRLPHLKYFAGMKMMNDMMKMNGDLDPASMGGMKMSNQTMDMNAVMYPEITGEEKKRSSKTGMPGMNMENEDIITLNYDMLRATHKSVLPAAPFKELNFTLTGNMNRYVWTMDHKTLSETDKILIKKGENLRIILYNNSMMRHPMHLHGHDFRVLNGQGDYAPLKNVLDIMPMERDTIEFAANASGDWFFHCHILYHMMSGMGRVFSYTNKDTTADPVFASPQKAKRKLFSDDRMFHLMAMIGIESSGSDGEAMLANTRWELNEVWHLGYHDMHGYESETMFGRYFGKMQWWYAYAGFDYHYKMEGGTKNWFGSEEKNWFGQTSDKLNRHTVIAGIKYTLPTLTVADFRVDGHGKFRLQLSREDIPVTPRLRFGWMINTDKEYMLGLRYIITKYISLSTHYDSDMAFGAGITFTY